MRSTTCKGVMLGASLAFGLVLGGLAQAETQLRVVGNFSGNKKQVDGVERPFFAKLDARDDLSVSYNTMDAIGVEAADALRLVSKGAFDVMSVQIGMASRDDPFFEGVDLAGVATNLNEQRQVVEAIRPAFDKRLQERWNTKLLTLWPFGPQMLFCNGDISRVEDIADKKVRVFTPSMSRLVKGLGATPVTLAFSEVYPALQRGVIDCAVTAPTAGNSAKWPEVTESFIPLPLSFSVQGHFMNLDTWKRMSESQQQVLTETFQGMEKQLWDIARDVNDDAIACNVGRDDCSEHERYDMKLVDIDEATREKVSEVTSEAVLPVWGKDCNNVYPECTAKWNATVGDALGYHIDLK